MNLILVPTLLALLSQPTAPFGQRRNFTLPDGGTMLYGISIPEDYDPQKPRPLVLALHPGGERKPGDGIGFLRSMALPGLRSLHAIIVAPDCPTRAWVDPIAERAVMALLQNILADYAIDRRRILVTGYSLGGRGTWFMSSRHADLFTGAIVMAGSPGDEPLDRLGTIPTYVIHSRQDQVVPFGPSESTALELEKLGRVVKFVALGGLDHYNMHGFLNPLGRAALWIAEQWEK